MIELCILLLNGLYDCDWTLNISEYKYGQYIGYTDWENKNIYITKWALHFGVDEFNNSILWHEIKHAQCRCMWH